MLRAFNAKRLGQFVDGDRRWRGLIAKVQGAVVQNNLWSDSNRPIVSFWRRLPTYVICDVIDFLMMFLSITLPELRAMKRSPRPTPPKISSGSTRPSEQVSIVAHGVCAFATCSRCLERSTAQSWGALTYFSFPAFSRSMASLAVMLVVWLAANAEYLPAEATVAVLANASETNRRRLGIRRQHVRHICPS